MRLTMFTQLHKTRAKAADTQIFLVGPYTNGTNPKRFKVNSIVIKAKRIIGNPSNFFWLVCLFNEINPNETLLKVCIQMFEVKNIETVKRGIAHKKIDNFPA